MNKCKSSFQNERMLKTIGIPDSPYTADFVRRKINVNFGHIKIQTMFGLSQLEKNPGGPWKFQFDSPKKQKKFRDGDPPFLRKNK